MRPVANRSLGHYNWRMPADSHPSDDAAAAAGAGIAYGLIAASCYAAASVCLRGVVNCPAVWVSCVKAAPTAIVAGLIVAREMWLGTIVVPPRKIIAWLCLSGAFVQIAGNAVNQWSLEVVGLAASTPLTFSGLLLFGAFLGRVWLGEPISYRTALGMACVLAAIPLIRWGAGTSVPAIAAGSAIETASATRSASPWLTTLGVLAACLSGVAYATQAAVIRKVVRGLVPLAHTLLIFSAMGVTTLGIISLVGYGPQRLATTSPRDFGVMLLAGVFNAGGFFSLSKSLARIPVAQVNTLNASQIAMTAGAGIVLFEERFTAPVGVGIALTIVGLLMRQAPKRV